MLYYEDINGRFLTNELETEPLKNQKQSWPGWIIARSG